MAKRSPLVTQHFENISRHALEKRQEIVQRYVRNRQGVYALYRRGKLYYVGLAGNLRSRLGQHLKDHHSDSWDRFSVYLTIGDSHLRELEALILRIVKPIGNKQKGAFAKSQNLRPLFVKDLYAKNRLEMDDLLGRDRPEPPKPRRKPPEGRQPVLAELITDPIKLRARFKGKFVTARVRRDGRISFGGRIFTSPSLAAAFACSRPTANGWTFWRFERSPGDWVVLDKLRR